MNYFGKAIRQIFTGFMVYVILAKCVYSGNILPQMIAVARIAITVGFIAVTIWKWDRIQTYAVQKVYCFNSSLSYRRMFLLLLACSLVTKVMLTCLLQITSISAHPDIQVYVRTAEELAMDGIVKTYADYCFGFSHMFWYAVFLAPAVRLCGSSQFAMSIYMAVIMTLSLLLMFDLLAYRAGKEKAFAVSIVLCILPSQLLINQYIIHEHALLFFLMTAVWLYFRVIPALNSLTAKGICYAFFTLSLLTAFLMNAAGLVMIIAFALLFLCEALRPFSLKNSCKRLGMLALLLAVVVLGSMSANSYQLRKSQLSSDFIKDDKILWTLFVGANAETNAGWSRSDVTKFSNYPAEASYSEIQQFRKDCLMNRYKALFQNPKELWNLLKNKSVEIWACFRYPIRFTKETVKSQTLRTIYNRLYPPIKLLEYTASLFGAIGCLAGIVRKKTFEIYDDRELVTELFLLGTTAMLLLTECNNKYTLALQPFFWMECFTFGTREKKAN